MQSQATKDLQIKIKGLTNLMGSLEVTGKGYSTTGKSHNIGTIESGSVLS